MLTYSKANMKLKVLADFYGYHYNQVVTFDLPAGFTCGKSDICMTFSNPVTGRITRVGRIMCYASKVEAYSPSCRRMRWSNFDQLKACKEDVEQMVNLLCEPLNDKIRIVRLHSSGDFYRQEYFNAWVKVATRNPQISFFGYTKELKHVLVEKPSNFVLEYSYGGKDDKVRDSLKFHVPTCYIEECAGQWAHLNIPTLCETHEAGFQDYIAIRNRDSFILPIH